MQISTPVVVIIYKRSNNIPKLFSVLSQVRPRDLYIIADYDDDLTGKVECNKTRKLTESSINWKTRIHKIYADKHLGLRTRIVSGLNIVFEHEEKAIILEDDLIPDISFFYYCENLLNKYKNNEQIISISGNNFLFGKAPIQKDYYFSAFTHSWGWATWKRAWNQYDDSLSKWGALKKSELLKVFPSLPTRIYWKIVFDLVKFGEIDSWSYRWTFAAILNKRLTAIPRNNLVKNIGYGKNATNTIVRYRTLNMSTGSIDSPFKHPKKIIRDRSRDELVAREVFYKPLVVTSLIVRWMLYHIKRILHVS